MPMDVTAMPLRVATPGVINYGNLTADGIVAMMRSRLRDLDNQIMQSTRSIESNTRVADEIGGRMGERRELQQALDRVPLDDDGNYDWDAELPEDPEAQATMVAERTRLQGQLESLGIAESPEAVQRSIDGLNEELRRANSGNEMLMVQLQSSMQERTAAIQMGSNMLKAMDEGTDAIVGNLR